MVDMLSLSLSRSLSSFSLSLSFLSLSLSLRVLLKQQSVFHSLTCASSVHQVYHYDDYVIECVGKKAGHQESITHAEADWTKKGLPVRARLNPFILDEFGGIIDTNALTEHELRRAESVRGTPSNRPPPVAPADY